MISGTFGNKSNRKSIVNQDFYQSQASTSSRQKMSMAIPKNNNNMFQKILLNKKVRNSAIVENGLEANNLVGALQESQK